MPTYLALEDYDELYRNRPASSIDINDLPNRTEEDREYFNNLVSETYTADMISIVPKCSDDCGRTTGEVNVGITCEHCGNQVKPTFAEQIASTVWFRRPDGVEKLMNPHVWSMISSRFTRSGYKILNYLTDRNYAPRVQIPQPVQEVITAGIPRGYNYFVQNFDEIMAFLFSLKNFRVKRKDILFATDMLKITHPSGDPLQQLIAENRDKIFSDHIPLPNKTLLVMEKTSSSIWIDNTILSIRDVMNTMFSIDKDHREQNVQSKENRTSKSLSLLADYYAGYFQSNLSPKSGVFRQNMYAGRSNYAFRAVITSHEDITDHDEIYIPWGVGVAAWRQHLLNHLMEPRDSYPRMALNTAIDFLYAHVGKYHERLDHLFKLLISETTTGGFLCVQQRNPSLMQGSAQVVRITKVKTNPHDTTVSMNDLIATSQNAI